MVTVATVPEDDVALLTAYRHGDQSAFARLVVRYQARLRGMCWNYLHDFEMVEDVMQDTFCHVLERTPSVTDNFNVSAWVHRIAANLCIDELRRRARRSAVHVSADTAGPAILQVIDADRSGRPDEALELDMTRQLVRAAIHSLPERQRDVLILRDVSGYSEAVTARRLGISCGSVQGLLHRAREGFKDAYVVLASDDAMPVECSQVAFVFEHLRLASLRKDRLRTVERHLAECPRCDARFGAPLAGSGATPAAAA
jgi:RNA polymerase sigma-70 factor (ECF subfamily)